MSAEKGGRGDLGGRLSRLAARDLRTASALKVTGLRPVSGGNAREAWAFEVSWSEGGAPHQRECVLLLQAKAGQLEQELAPEFGALAALGGSGVPAPDAYWLDADGSVLGSPGFVMERVAGETALRTLLDPEHGQSQGVALEMADAAAALHSLEVTRFRGVLPPVEPEAVALQQVAAWERLFLAHRMEPLPVLSEAFRWLRHRAPRTQRVSLVHGDFRFGNVVYQDGELRALLDWEMTHLGDPCEDLAWAYRALWSPVAHLPFAAFLRRYAESGGPAYSEENLLFYRLLGEVKHAVISVTGAHSFAVGQSDNLRLADRMTWVPECLQQFVEWCPDFSAAPERS